MVEWNPLVLSGECERVFVTELEPGDTTASGEVVEYVVRLSDHNTIVKYTNGQRATYGNGNTTVLVATHN